MDDNDNRLFGVTAEIAWVPKPAYQLTLRTPLYAVQELEEPKRDLTRRANHRHIVIIATVAKARAGTGRGLFDWPP